jgi:hypothetical protein
VHFLLKNFGMKKLDVSYNFFIRVTVAIATYF